MREEASGVHQREDGDRLDTTRRILSRLEVGLQIQIKGNVDAVFYLNAFILSGHAVTAQPVWLLGQI